MGNIWGFLVVICENCGNENDMDATFCEKCGTNLKAQQSTIRRGSLSPPPKSDQIATSTGIICCRCGTGYGIRRRS